MANALVQNSIKRKYLSRGVEPEEDVVAQDILDEYKAKNV